MFNNSSKAELLTKLDELEELRIEVMLQTHSPNENDGEEAKQRGPPERVGPTTTTWRSEKKPNSTL